MSVQTAKSKLSFQLPSMSYIDAGWEEPDLRAPTPAKSTMRKRSLATWLSRQTTALAAWLRDREAARELLSMSDRELMDIGLNRADISRALNPALNGDLRQRGRAF